MSNYWRHEEPGEFEVDMTVEGRDLSETDHQFAKSILASAGGLFQKATDHLIPFLNPTKEEFSEPPFLNRIEIFPNSEATYQVKVEFHFPNDEGANWWVRFNVPYPFPPFPYGSDRTYWPVEFGQLVEQ